MEQQRLLLFIALFVVLFLLWDSWQQEFGPQPQPQKITQTDDGTVAMAPVGGDADVPISEGKPAAQALEPFQDVAVVKTAQRIEVLTDVFRAEIDATGGDLRVVDLLKYPVKANEPDKPFRLMRDSMSNLFLAQSGFTLKKSQNGEILTAAPNHTTIYKVEQSRYVLSDDKDKLDVNLVWTSPQGVQFTKTYRFSRGSYLVEVSHTVNNPTGKDWRGHLYQQLQRAPLPESEKPSFIYTYTGGVVYSPEEKYKKIDFSDMDDKNLRQQVTGGWTAMIQHYFLGAWIPPAEQPQVFYTQHKAAPDRYTIGMKSEQGSQVAAGSQQRFSNKLYVGPKLQKKLETITPGLELTVDYGALTILAKPLFWLLDKIHGLVNNWGWAIVILTLLIKLAFYKLSETSYKSMAQMRKLGPRLQQLKERYGDDRQKMSQAQMEMFKKEKINPLGGCLPILVQIPVFIALYWVLLESVELRQAEWILWIKDMSTADPYFILPLLMGVTMFIQQKLNPAPMDPIQAKVMMTLPFVFTVFFAFFPAGLVLYWVANNTLSIMQQWYITRIVIKS